MHHRIKKQILPALLLLAPLLLTACGGGGGGAVLPLDAPVISNMTYSPASAKVNTLFDGTVEFDYEDSGGNIDSITTIATDPDGMRDTRSYPLPMLSGATQGHISLTWKDVIFTKIGDYTITIYLSDSRGTTSNRLSAPFTVTP